MKEINVLSLFDGMSCCQIALERAGINVDNYFASEIDKYAIQVTMANYPNTIQLGSVVNVDGTKLPEIFLMAGGSPCQSFSFAGKRKGMSTKCEQEILTLEHYLELKAENFEFEGQSYLFWEYMRLLKEVKPKYFLLENVMMGEKWEKILSKAIGVNGIYINSALVSAQNRKRIYWTNIGLEPAGLFSYPMSIIRKPKDKGILLKDVLETEVDEKYFLSEKMVAGFVRHSERHKKKGTGFSWDPNEGNQKGNCLRANAAICATDNIILAGSIAKTNGFNEKEKSVCLDANYFKGIPANQDRTCVVIHNTNAVEIVALTEVRTQEAKRIIRETGTNPKRSKELVERIDGKIGAILTSQTPDNLIKISKSFRYREVKQINTNNKSNKGIQPYQQDRVYDIIGLMTALDSSSSRKSVYVGSKIRRLTPLECERLQTVSDNYTAHVSDSQRYKMLGNGWTIEVIKHIFSYIL